VPSKVRRRRNGQAMVEFALVLPLLLIVLFGTIECSRMMSLYLAIQDLTRRGAVLGSAVDPTLSRRPAQVAQDTFELLQTSVPLRYTIYGAWVDQPPDDAVVVDVNHVIDDVYHTKVSVSLTMNFLLLPGWGRNNSGFLPISSTAVIPNETQGQRRDAKDAYKERRFQIIELGKGNVKKELEALER